jgi:hypothetical protein
MFKSNSRFAALVEPAFNQAEKNEVISKAEKNESTTDNKPRNNHFLSNESRPVYNESRPVYNESRPVYNESRPVSNEIKPVYNDSNLFSQKVIDKAQQQRKDDNHQRLMDETAKILSIDNFPEMQLSKKVETLKKPCSFAEKLKQKENPPEINDKSLEKPFISFSEKLKQVDVVIENKVNEIPYGWAVIKRDPITKKQITEYNKEYENDLKRAENLEKKQWPMKVLGALVDLYERERDTYINKWGYDAYEEKYLDPDYDDEYFDRLDEAYAASESEEEYESEDDEEYNSQIKHWKH